VSCERKTDTGKVNSAFQPSGIKNKCLAKLFSQPPNNLSNYALGGQLCTIYIGFTSQFWLGSDRRKVQPPASSSQFKYCAFTGVGWLCPWTPLGAPPPDPYYRSLTLVFGGRGPPTL